MGIKQDKLLYLDLETTGTAVGSHGIVQLAALVEIGGDIADELVLDMAPFVADRIEPEALKVSGIPQEGLFDRLPPKHAYLSFVDLVTRYVDRYNKQDKFHLVGYNALGFDGPFLRRFFEKNGDKWFGSYFWFPPLDVMALAAEYVAPYRHTLASFKLMDVCRSFGIEVDEDRLHDAMVDIKLTRELYQKINFLKGEEGGAK